MNSRSHIELGTSDLEDPLKFGENQLFYNFDPMRVYYYHTISLYEEEGNDLGLIRLTKTVTFTGKSKYKMNCFTNYLFII